MTILFSSDVCPRTDYIVEFISNELEVVEFDILNETNFSPSTFYGLVPGAMYKATVRANSPYGKGERSLPSNSEETGKFACFNFLRVCLLFNRFH